MKRNIVLTGLSGSGKTTLGRMLAELCSMTFTDLDEEIEREAGMPVTRIFAEWGEERFRDLESQVIRRTAGMRNTVIATGGGAVLRQENVDALGDSGLMVFLDRPPDRIVQDVHAESRPLLQAGAERIFELSEQRRERYLKCADLVFKNHGTLKEAAITLPALIRSRVLPSGYAVIGDPIAHSLSPDIHNAVFEQIGVKANYTTIHVPSGTLPDFVARARGSDLRGFNVTAPHKQDIIPLLDRVEKQARQCGAVNTVVRDAAGRLYGYNTDMDGLLFSVRSAGYEYHGSNIVILGTGGAACGVALKAAMEGAAQITILGRRPQKAEELRARIEDVLQGVRIMTGDLCEDRLRFAAENCDILISTIPAGTAGMEGESVVPLSFITVLPAYALVCDMIYNPPHTQLLQEARNQNHTVLNGLGMLIWQAVLADEIYLRQTLDRKAAYRAALESVKRKGQTT